MKNLKNILVFTATLLALTVAIHSFLPHDHHFASGFDLDNSKHSNHSESHHEFHCFSLNNALLSKPSIKIINHIVTFNQLLFKLYGSNEVLGKVANSENIFVSFPKTELLRLRFSKQLPLRGSPLF